MHFVSPQTIANRKQLQLLVDQPTDAPVCKDYVDQLKVLGVQSLQRSRWLNAISAFITDEQRQHVQQLPFVVLIQPIEQLQQIASLPNAEFKPEHFTTVLNQVSADAFVEAGLTGNGVKIGVIDVGFFGVHQNRVLKHLVQEQRIKDVRDFVNPQKTSHFNELETSADYHGTEVLQMITGYDPDKKVQYGMAINADFYLARTDHGTRETRTEEDNWVAAMERMDSLGIQLINTSLGYALGFTNPKENYKPAEMDGHTSLISRAARIATEEKGMLVIVSAGNEGDDANWRIVSTPADAEGVISVGSTKSKSRDRISYSSVGPDFLHYLKPNIACFSPSGTSFAAPVITGFAACLMEKKPDLTNKQLRRIIEQSAHLYPFGNNYVGFGVPNAEKALQLLEDSTLLLNQIQQARPESDTCELPIEDSSVERAVVFHKKSDFIVIRQELLGVEKGKLTLKRMKNETRTTVDFGNRIVEVFWEEW